jgi:epidermal growth factor receptor substrate 15
MPSHLSHSLLVEEPGQDATPAAEDDIEAVKTLCGMGFSRTQAVTALEQHDYDVQRALNSLLGKPSTLCHGVQRDADGLLRHPINRF